MEDTAVNDQAAQAEALRQAGANATEQEIGESVVNQAVEGGPPIDPETGQEIPHHLTTEGSRNTVGVDHSINPETGEKKPVTEEPEARVEDEDTARMMASAGDRLRTSAADTRRVAEARRQFQMELYDIVKDPRYLDPGLRNKILKRISASPGDFGDFAYGTQLPKDVSQWALKELKKHDYKFDTDGYFYGQGPRDADISGRGRGYYQDVRAAEAILDGTFDPEDTSKYDDAMEKATRHDKYADKKEEQVRRLYKPVSEVYKEAHPDLDLSLDGLRDLEDALTTNNGLFGRESLLPVDLDESPLTVQMTTERLAQAVAGLESVKTGEEDDQLVAKYYDIGSNGGTTLNDLQALNRQIRERHNAIMKGKAQQRARVYLEVVSGKAGEQNPPNGDDKEALAA